MYTCITIAEVMEITAVGNQFDRKRVTAGSTLLLLLGS